MWDFRQNTWEYSIQNLSDVCHVLVGVCPSSASGHFEIPNCMHSVWISSLKKQDVQCMIVIIAGSEAITNSHGFHGFLDSTQNTKMFAFAKSCLVGKILVF